MAIGKQTKEAKAEPVAADAKISVQYNLKP